MNDPAVNEKMPAVSKETPGNIIDETVRDLLSIPETIISEASSLFMEIPNTIFDIGKSIVNMILPF